MSKLLVGHGYLGAPIAALWRSLGERVAVTTRSADRAGRLASLGMKPVVCDVRDPASLRALPDVDTVVCCVGFDRAAGASMRDVYVNGLRNVLEALPGSPRVIYVSSTGVYGPDPAGKVIDETMKPAPADESGRLVLEAEGVLRDFSHPWTVLRFAGIYGPGRLLREKALRAGEPVPSAPDKHLNLIHVVDGAAAVVAAAARGEPGRVYNVCDGSPPTRRKFYSLMASLLGAPEVRFVPSGPEGGDRVIGNRRMREELGVALRYPTYVEGLRASVG